MVGTEGRAGGRLWRLWRRGLRVVVAEKEVWEEEEQELLLLRMRWVVVVVVLLLLLLLLLQTYERAQGQLNYCKTDD
jgi:uncharacterized integral membrane protein